MFLTVYLSNNDQHFSEVPITPETLCRDVVELCKEPGEADCYLAETWRGCGVMEGEVRYLLHHQRPPGRDSGTKHLVQTGRPAERCLENGVSQRDPGSV
uniref:Ras association domain-containing protein n=1 Tax=Echeneis naucrates TaxID=173247 RepID=A0A665TC04_ECHNA